MTERIDHAAKAKSWLESAAYYTYEEPEDQGAAGLNLAAAQVHATLALVEQQRIANLLAWVEVGADNGVDALFLRKLHRADIKEGLGLS